MKPLIHSLSRHELDAVLTELDVPRYRGDQLWRGLYVRHADAWESMHTLPGALRAALAERFRLSAGRVEAVQAADGTQKLLVALDDNECIEAVMIPAGPRRTVCVSSQVGCGFRCAFCASGQAGLRRALDTGEIVQQVLLAARVWGTRPTHVVYMGIGEPFDNVDNVLKSIRILNDAKGLAIGARRITVSTCGVVPGLTRLAEEKLQVELSVSLHAANDALRSRLMPVNRRWPLAALMAACKAYTAATRRIITFEYTLIAGCNDRPDDARAVAALLRDLPARVNLIPLSAVAEYPGAPTPPRAAETFRDIVADAGINVTLRTSRGGAVRAACGQLRATAGRAGEPPA